MQSDNFGLSLIESTENYNLAIVRSNRGIILGRKTRGYGVGRLVLPGGKDKYQPDGALGLSMGAKNARRELLEETGIALAPEMFSLVANLDILTEDDEKTVQVFHAPCHPDIKFEDSDELVNVGWFAEHAFRTLN